MTRLTFAVVVLLAAGSAQAACIYPRAPTHTPDGQTATRDEMVAAQAAVQQFNEDITAYNSCLDMEMRQAETSGAYDENRLSELRAIQAKKNNAAVDEVTAVAETFNEQLRIFLAREKKSE